MKRVSLSGRVADSPAAEVDHDAVLDLRAAVAALPARQRATLVLRFFCDLSVDQAAEILGCSPGTVKSQTAKALAAVRRALGPDLGVYAAGQCHLTGPAGELKCSAPTLGGLTARITGRAPAIRGHRAFWADPYLVWQYARGGWAGLLLPTSYISPKLSNAVKREAVKREAVKIAGHVRYGAATPPLVFAAQLTGLPSRWRVGSVYYQPDGGVLRASRFALTTGTPDLGADGGLEFQTNLPSFTHRPRHLVQQLLPNVGLRDHQRLPGGRDPPGRRHRPRRRHRPTPPARACALPTPTAWR